METVTSVEKLRLKFPGEKGLLFRDLSLSLYPGEKVLFLGPSGCGKSTLLQVLTGLIPQSVAVPVKFENLTLPESWGYVFQDPDSQFCMPFVDEEIAFVLENLQIPRAEMPGLIRDYLQQVGLDTSDIHTNIKALSQGMKQRLAIASVLALEPEVLFLDEPTALLDPEGTKQVWETMKQVSKDKTVIIVEHKIEHIVDFVDRVVLFNNQGEIIADGERNEVFHSHLDQLIEYGIWYPKVWEDYISSHNYQQIGFVRETSSMEIKPSMESKPTMETKPTMATNSTIELQDFQGYRGKDARIEVTQNQISSHEWICVVGANGAGKSTLLLALMQLIKTSGAYSLKGTPIANIKNLSQQVGFVFQNPEFQFVTNSTEDEIAYTLQILGEHPQEISTKVEALLTLFELSDKNKQHPYQLSMGQKRRLSVATAIVKDQEFLLLDEPTFGQDAKNTFALLELIEECRVKGTSILMVTHDLKIVEHFATRVWEVEDGRLLKDMTPEEYLKDKYSRATPAQQKEEVVCP